jgi:uncharacterized protein YihD (DUF1040 family)
MMIAGNSNTTLEEKEFLEVLQNVILGGSEEHKSKRIEALEELRRRIASDCIQEKNEVLRILLDIAKEHGYDQPEAGLISESLTLSIQKHKESLKTLLMGLEEKKDKRKEGLLFICFSQVVPSLDFDQKRHVIKHLVSFLMTRDVLNDVGVSEVCGRLISLGNEKLDKEIVKESSPYLNSPPLKLCAIIFSVRLCAAFGDENLALDMLKVLEKSMKGYYDGHYTEIERDICHFLERVSGQKSLPLLLRLLRTRSNEHLDHIINAVAKVLDACPNCVNDVLEMLHDELNRNIVDALIQALERMKEPKVDPRKLLHSIHINWNEYPRDIYMKGLFVKMGELSKPTLFELLSEKEKHCFALRCLKEIGVSREEISRIFPKPPMLQVYDFLYGGRSKNPRNLTDMWKDKKDLGGQVPGKPTMLEHILLSVLASFNFATLHVDSAGDQARGIDLACFYPETLDLFIIGCTVGILKDDLSKMDLISKKMKAEMTELFNRCSLTPIILTSEPISISESDAKLATGNGIIIMRPEHIDALLEMLGTNRQGREIVEYIKSIPHWDG